ncbi:MAG: Arc family DNA-binding protein [Thermoleophilia bacterium]|nr:Arc family DNA-binding protein [Thermoleophilia bacterium]
MPVSLSIKNVPEEVAQRLRARARRNHRSLQNELLAIVEAASLEDDEITLDELAEYVESLGFSTPDEGTAWIRELRDTR